MWCGSYTYTQRDLEPCLFFTCFVLWMEENNASWNIDITDPRRYYFPLFIEQYVNRNSARYLSAYSICMLWCHLCLPPHSKNMDIWIYGMWLCGVCIPGGSGRWVKCHFSLSKNVGRDMRQNQNKTRKKANKKLKWQKGLLFFFKCVGGGEGLNSGNLLLLYEGPFRCH